MLLTTDPGPLGDPADIAARRAAWRQFVLQHHPDRGGDPAVFAAGARNVAEGRWPDEGPRDRFTSGSGYLTTHHSPRGLGHVTTWVRRRWQARTRPPRVQ